MKEELNMPIPESTLPAGSNGNKAKKGFNKNSFLAAGLVILTGVLLIVSISSRNNNGGNSVTTVVKEAHSTLSIENQRESETPGVSEVDVNIDSGSDKLTGVQLDIVYDPKVLTNVDIKPGDFFTSPQAIKKIDQSKGTISYVLVNPQSDKGGTKGTGVLATITFSKTSDGPSEIKFLPSTIATAQGSSQSVLKMTTSGLVK